MPKAYFNRAGIEEIIKERLDLAEKKNNDYGGRTDNIEIAGIHGVAVRLLDKATRLLSLTTPGQEQQIKTESIRDTFLDAANYADFGTALLDGTWGVRPPEPIVMDWDASVQRIAQATGIRPGMIRFQGHEMSVNSLCEIFTHLGKPIGVPESIPGMQDSTIKEIILGIPNIIQKRILTNHNHKVKERADARTAMAIKRKASAKKKSRAK